jgi:hypothetical protein
MRLFGRRRREGSAAEREESVALEEDGEERQGTEAAPRARARLHPEAWAWARRVRRRG